MTFKGIIIGNWRQETLITFKYSLYKTNADQPDTTPANNAYVNLDTNKLVVYCDYQRFNNWENKNCAGETKKGFVCDPYLKISYPMGDIYTGCKNSDTVLGNMGTVVQVCTAYKNQKPLYR